MTVNDENLFKLYFSALLSSDTGGIESDADMADMAVTEHRKRFPKKVAPVAIAPVHFKKIREGEKE